MLRDVGGYLRGWTTGGRGRGRRGSVGGGVRYAWMLSAGGVHDGARRPARTPASSRAAAEAAARAAAAATTQPAGRNGASSRAGTHSTSPASLHGSRRPPATGLRARCVARRRGGRGVLRRMLLVITEQGGVGRVPGGSRMIVVLSFGRAAGRRRSCKRLKRLRRRARRCSRMGRTKKTCSGGVTAGGAYRKTRELTQSFFWSQHRAPLAR